MLIKKIVAIAALQFIFNTAWAESPTTASAFLKTDLGNIVIELYPDEAPVTVANFIRYAQEDFYNGTIFHRVIPGFVVQGGGHTFDYIKKETHDPITNESDNGLKNTLWTLSMARMPHPDSATSQFFINLNNNPHLDPIDDNAGYAVFAKVVEGFEVLDAITKEPQGRYRPEAPDIPVRILKMHLDIPAPLQSKVDSYIKDNPDAPKEGEPTAEKKP